MEQKMIVVESDYRKLDEWINKKDVKRAMLVCGGSLKRMSFFTEHLDRVKRDVEIIPFSDFCPNPQYESVMEGVKRFRTRSCDAIIAVGGGSAMDVAKCIKLYSNMNGDGENGGYLRQEIVPNGIPFLAIPTTAGTGSEATRFAVVYYEGVKQSVMSENLIPDTVLMDGRFLNFLPMYQKKVTMMDGFCHALESFWSVNSTKESKGYSRKAIEMVLKNMEGYLANTEDGNWNMLAASHLAGRAINITQTTAGHAMCYKITSLFGLAHGHAAILCNRILFPWMIENTDKCVDLRGEEYVKSVFGEIARAMGCETEPEAAWKVKEVFERLKLPVPVATAAQFEELKMSVNPVRLKNHPIQLSGDTIDMLYHKILREQRISRI